MALSANTVFEVRPAGGGAADTNGGGFVTGASGTDWSIAADGPQYSVTDAVTAGTTSIVSATANFGTDVVGNIAYIEGGTAPITAGWYQIISRTNSTTIVVDRSTGLTAGTGATLNIGGALASPGLTGTLMGVSGQKTWIKAGTYVLTTSTPGAGGPFNGGSNILYTAEGYQTTRGDLGTRPVIDAGAVTSIIMWNSNQAVGNQYALVTNIELDGKNGSGNNGFGAGQRYVHAYKCIARNFSQATTNYGYGEIERAIECQALVCGKGFNRPFVCELSYAKDCTNWGFSMHQSALNHCIAVDCAKGFTDETGNVGEVLNCTAYSNTGNGFDSNKAPTYVNCVAVANGAYGFGGDGTARVVFIKCATQGNSSGAFQTANNRGTPTALSGDPFVDSSTFDFRPDATSGEGAALRDAGVGAASQTDNRDIGAVQHADVAGGSGRPEIRESNL